MSSIASGASSILSAQMTQLQTSGQIATRVARKALDNQQEQGQEVIDLLQGATELAKRAGEPQRASAGADGRLDVMA